MKTGAISLNIGSSSNSKNNLNAQLTKQEFLDKFYKPLDEKKDSIVLDIPKSNSSDLSKMRQSVFGSLGLGKKQKDSLSEFNEKHKKLFDRNIKFSTRKKSSTDANAFQKKTNIFEALRKDYSDPFERAKESSATLGQISVVNTCMFSLGLFSVLLSVLCYSFEYDEVYDRRLYTMLSLCMFCSIIEVALYFLKLRLNVEL